MGANLALALIGLVSGTLVARLLGPAGRGELAAIQLWPPLLAYIAMVGLPEAVVFFSVRKPARVGTYLMSSLPVAGLAGVPIMIVAYFLLPELLSSQSSETITAARWYLAFIPLGGVLRISADALLGRKDYLGWNSLRLAPNISWLVLVVAAFLLGWSRVPRLTATYLVVLTALALITFVTVHRRLALSDLKCDTTVWRPMLGYGLPSIGATLPNWVSVRLDQFVLVSLIDPAELGVYVVAVSWAGATLPLLRGFAQVILPEVASLTSEKKRRNAMIKSVRAGIAATSILVLSLFFATPFVMPLLFGPAFERSVPIAFVLIAGGGLQGLNFILQQVVRGSGKTRSLIAPEIAGLFFIALGLVLLLGPFGTMGAAVSSSLGFLVSTSILFLVIKAIVGCSIRDLLLPQRQDLVYLGERLRRVRARARTHLR